MKTYKDFKNFVIVRRYMEFDYTLEEAAKAGFSRVQIWWYICRMKWEYQRPRFRAALRRAGRVVWWCLVVVSAFVFFNRVNKLIDVTTYKNQTEVARNVVYVCGRMPEICPSAAELVKKVMK